MSALAETAEVFKYTKPEGQKPKEIQMLARTDIQFSAVQVVREGGETNLHSHGSLDGFWFVLKGGARFYTTNDEVIGELGPHEGILIPRGYKYWFERMGDEELEILQVESSSKPMRTLADITADRDDVASERPAWIKDGDADRTKES